MIISCLAQKLFDTLVIDCGCLDISQKIIETAAVRLDRLEKLETDVEEHKLQQYTVEYYMLRVYLVGYRFFNESVKLTGGCSHGSRKDLTLQNICSRRYRHQTIRRVRNVSWTFVIRSVTLRCHASNMTFLRSG